MRIFVIGGTGFISRRLVQFLLDAGHEVTTFTRGTRSEPEHSRLTRRHGDRDDETALRQAAGDGAYDAVFDIVAYLPAQSRAAVRVFRERTRRFIHCSTISVYMVSDAVRYPVAEDQDHLPPMAFWPRNPFGMQYGLDKRVCEDVLWAAHDAETFPVSMLRPTYVSGPHDPTARDHFWIARLLDGQPLLVPGSGDVAFQQVFVDDVARAFAALLDHPASIGKAYNVADERIVTLDEYLHLLGRLLGVEPDLVHVDQAVFDRLPFSTHPHGDVFPFNTRSPALFDLSQIRRDLGFRSTPYEDWMRETVAWYRAHAEEPARGYERRAEEVAFAQRWRQARQAMIRHVLD